MPAVVTEVGHSPMRPEVRAFVADGPLPYRDASEDEIDRRDRQSDATAGPMRPAARRDCETGHG